MTNMVESGPRATGRHRRRRRWVPWLVGVLMLAAAGTGIGLIVQGSTSTLPPPAPSPDRPFALVTPPSALLPGDVIPPPTGSVTAPDAGPSAAGSAAADRAPASGSGGVSAGSDTEPPVHTGPWTFEGAQRIFIQSLGVEAPIDTVGSNADGMIIPTDVRRVGRWDGGAGLDATEGTTLIAGHVNYASQGPGVLYNLYRIRAGAVIVTNDAAGRRTSWRVTGLESVNKQALPADIFTRAGPRRLVLVTCGGDLLHIDGPNGGINTYENNIIVRAVPA